MQQLNALESVQAENGVLTYLFRSCEAMLASENGDLRTSSHHGGESLGIFLIIHIYILADGTAALGIEELDSLHYVAVILYAQKLVIEHTGNVSAQPSSGPFPSAKEHLQNIQVALSHHPNQPL